MQGAQGVLAHGGAREGSTGLKGMYRGGRPQRAGLRVQSSESIGSEVQMVREHPKG